MGWARRGSRDQSINSRVIIDDESDGDRIKKSVVMPTLMSQMRRRISSWRKAINIWLKIRLRRVINHKIIINSKRETEGKRKRER